MTSYRTKSRTVDAIRYTGDNQPEVLAFMGGEQVARIEKTHLPGPGRGMTSGINIITVNLRLPVRDGQWIIRHQETSNTYQAMWNDVFERTYEPVTEPNIQIHIEPDPPHIAEAIADIRRHGLPPITRR